MENILIVISEAVEINEQNFECPKGDNLEMEFTFKDDDGAVIDISAGEVEFIAKRFPDQADDDADTISEELDLTNGDEGLASLDIETTDLEKGVYFYRVVYTDVNEKVKTVLRGKIVITAGG